MSYADKLLYAAVYCNICGNILFYAAKYATDFLKRNWITMPMSPF